MTFRLRPVALEAEFEFDDNNAFLFYGEGGSAIVEVPTDVEVGAPITFSAKVNNVGEGEGAATVWLQRRSGSSWEWGANINIMSGTETIPAHASKTTTPTSGTYNMPNEEVFLRLIVLDATAKTHDTYGHRALKHKLKRAWRRMLGCNPKRVKK